MKISQMNKKFIKKKKKLKDNEILQWKGKKNLNNNDV